MNNNIVQPFEMSFNSIIIDIRNKNSYNCSHIKNAVNFSHDDLIYNHKSILDKKNLYYIYCEKGVLSNKTSTILNSLGYDTYSLDGGYNKYLVERKNN